MLAYHDVYVATVPNCQPAAAAGIRVYPPGQTASMVVHLSLMVCANVTTNATASVASVTAVADLHP